MEVVERDRDRDRQREREREREREKGRERTKGVSQLQITKQIKEHKNSYKI